jgi:hypothetical protein
MHLIFDKFQSEYCKPSMNEMIIYYFLYPSQFFREIKFSKAFKHFMKK